MLQTENSELGLRVKALEQENQQLRQKVVEVERERVQYLQNVSHQLVAPLNAINWHIENLTEARVSIERAKNSFDPFILRLPSPSI
jgi:signal transduction histidine kinase